MADQGPDERSDLIVSTLLTAFEPLMEADPHGFRTKFRKMARDPFAFYRGSACLFYADVGEGGGTRASTPTGSTRSRRGCGSRVTSTPRTSAPTSTPTGGSSSTSTTSTRPTSATGPGTSPASSPASPCMSWQKALPDDTIDDLVARYVRAYVDQVEHYRSVADDTEWALTLDTAEGAVLDALHRAKLSTRFGMLESMTVVEDHRRRFADGPGVRRLEDDELGPRRSGVRAVPAHAPRVAAGRRDLRRPRRRRPLGLRDRQRGPAGVQRPHRGVHPGARQRRRPVDEAGQRRGAEPGRPRRARRLLLRAPRPPDRDLPARPPGPRRPLPRVDLPARAPTATSATSSARSRPTRPTCRGTTSPSPRTSRSSCRSWAGRRRRSTASPTPSPTRTS